MVSDSQTTSLERYLPHVVLCTSAVAVIPIALVTFLESSGWVDSLVLSLAIGAAVSVTIATVGSKIWMAWFDATDVVFGDLLLWGWLRRLRNERRMKRSVDRLGLRHNAASSATPPVDRQSRVRALKDLARALETRDPYTHGHSRRVERHSYMIAKAMRLPEHLAETIRVAASVHDVGKLDVPMKVLRKPGKLTDAEFDLIKEHSARGAEMVAALGDPGITEMVRHHHERLDGKGYPDGLAGGDIPMGARIIAAADTFDAIVSSRSYRGAARHKRAIEIMRSEAGVQLDRDVVAAFLSYYSGRSSFEWWASVSTLPQRALRVFGVDGASSTAVAQGAAVVTAGVVLGSSSIVPWNLDSFRSDLASESGHTEMVRELAAAGYDLTGSGFGAAGLEGEAGREGSRPGAGDLWALLDEDDLARSDLIAEAERDADSAESGSTRPVRDAVDDTTKTVGDTVDDTTKAVEDAAKPVKDIVDDTTKTVDDTTKKVGDTVDDTTKKVGDTVDDTTKAVDDTTKTVTDTVDDTTKKVLGSPYSY